MDQDQGREQKKLTLFTIGQEINQLHAEHDRIMGALKERQKEVSFYQSVFQRSTQIETALKKGSAPTPPFKPEFLADQGYLETIRELIVQSVYARWNAHREPSSLQQIYSDVRSGIVDLIKIGRWHKWQIPGKRTCDRRVNECADFRFYSDGVTPCIGIRGGQGGLYIPNPARFSEEAKEELQKVVNYHPLK